MKYDNQLRYATQIIQDYKGSIPLAAWLKSYFRDNKQMGSKDRKTVSTLLYNYYRLGKSFNDLPLKEKIIVGLFLSNNKPLEILEYFRPELNAGIAGSLDEKTSYLKQNAADGFSLDQIFPWQQELSDGIDKEKFTSSFLIQPDLFIRIRPGKRQLIVEKLQAAGISYNEISEQCLSFPNSTRLEEIIDIDKDAVIQDYNSQQTGAFFFPQQGEASPRLTVWDSCAASGGKSIMAFDINPSIQLTVSDIRESIIRNLDLRFQRAGIKSYTSFVADLSTGNGESSASASGIPRKSYDLVIADLPCSGSGTWSRTPEQLYFFTPEKLEHYASLQKRIMTNLLKHVEKEGRLVYLTCSVFRKENEEIVRFIQDNSSLTLERAGVLKGYDMKADSMYAASFIL